ncbi:lymphocyte antigen 6C2 [Nasonia vitripennis]|uniref:Uncharacterized protein n=1 Tax=Nasonia vitripennis TaxID=7425 RepID=A0A7M7GE11_NASVI|nr:lymphocyte antigen 6C2 [Nasonia vitripennis]
MARTDSTMMTLPVLLVALLACVGIAEGLSCYKCGQYNDGVGSITPCINYTATQLQECPKTSKHCIKYVSEGSTVRDCVPTCQEKEAWSTRTYCCSEDGCNGAPGPFSSSLCLAAFLLFLIFQRQQQQLRG